MTYPKGGGMKKALTIVSCLVLCLALSMSSFAEETNDAQKEPMGMGMGMGLGVMGSGGMECPGRSDKDAMMKHKKMMMGSMMMDKKMVATSDGGVVVLVGGKLLKYDKNLILKNEAELKIDKKDMHKMMWKNKEKYDKNTKSEEGKIGMEKEAVEEVPQETIAE